MEDNQNFVDSAEARGEKVLMHLDPSSGDSFIVAGPQQSIDFLCKIIDDYEQTRIQHPDSHLFLAS